MYFLTCVAWIVVFDQIICTILLKIGFHFVSMLFPCGRPWTKFCKKSIVTNYFVFFRKGEHSGHMGEKQRPFSKIFSVFRFWTFLKMSIFDFGPDFFLDKFKSISCIYIFSKQLKEKTVQS
jgi:hypothetical protein